MKFETNNVVVIFQIEIEALTNLRIWTNVYCEAYVPGHL